MPAQKGWKINEVRCSTRSGIDYGRARNDADTAFNTRGNAGLRRVRPRALVRRTWREPINGDPLPPSH